MLLFDSSISVLSLVYQEFDFALKSPPSNIHFCQPYNQNLILNCLKAFQIHLKNLQTFPPTLNSKLIHSFK